MTESSTGPDEGLAAPCPDFQSLFESAPTMLLALDCDLRIIAVSDGYLQCTQTRRDELIGWSIWDALEARADDQPPGAVESLRTSLDRVCRDLCADTMEVQKRYLLRPGARGTFEVCYFRPSNVPVLGRDGGLCYIIHRLEDVTAQIQEVADARRAEASADTTKNEFVSRISHEMRSPINTILGFGELLSLGELSAEHREWASMIRKAARHLAAFMDDVVDISRAQARKLSLTVEAVAVCDVIADAIDLIRPLATSYGVQLAPPPQTGEWVMGDQQRLRQILLNLLSNAVKYNHPAGRVTVTIDCPQDSRCRISVVDTGRGIAGYDIARLFTPFQRLDAAAAGIEGAGLGLTLSRELVEAMGGTVGATSTHGEGSVFWVELPLTQQATIAPAATDVHPVMTSRAYAGPKTVLYVEDMVETLRLVEHIFKQRPSTSIVPAMLGGVALDLAAQHHPDLILLDLNLPDMPGEELLQRIKSDPATTAIPVIIISADADQDRIDRLLAAGASGYLTKPISVRGFLQVIDTLLDQPAAPPSRPAEHERAGATWTPQAQPAHVAKPRQPEQGAPDAGHSEAG